MIKDMITYAAGSTIEEIKDTEKNPPPPYKGELDTVKKELEDNINKLILDFENKYKVYVFFGKSKKSIINIGLVIDLNTSKFRNL